MTEIQEDLQSRTQQDVSLQFAKLLAKYFDTDRSSHVYFFMQQAYETVYPDIEWTDVQAILNKIIREEE